MCIFCVMADCFVLQCICMYFQYCQFLLCWPFLGVLQIGSSLLWICMCQMNMLWFAADSESVDVPVSENYFSTPKRFRSAGSPNASLSFNPEVQYQQLERRRVYNFVIVQFCIYLVIFHSVNDSINDQFFLNSHGLILV